MSGTAYMIAARRTAVMPRGGAFAALQADELAAPVLKQLLRDAGHMPSSVDHVILGNALYGGGNPARLAALRAGLPSTVPALTIDTQCCSGLDAIIMASRVIEAGAADCVLAGGMESFSRAPIRMHRPVGKADDPVPYERPPFAPPPFADPDLNDAAARLARDLGITASDQAGYAVASHAKAVSGSDARNRHLVPVAANSGGDGFTRELALKTALRAPVLAGDARHGLTAATVAIEADGAAAVLLVSERVWKETGQTGLQIAAGRSEGGDPADPALVPVSVATALLEALHLSTESFDCVELMEAYAAQAMVTIDRLGIDPARLNSFGGALARGHPIGASGAILAVQLFERMVRTQRNAEFHGPERGLALIAAAGGLGSGLAVERCVCKGG